MIFSVKCWLNINKKSLISCSQLIKDYEVHLTSDISNSLYDELELLKSIKKNNSKNLF